MSTVALGTCLALAACAGVPSRTAWLEATGDKPVPIVLRMPEPAPRNDAMPSPGGELAGNATTGVLLGLGFAIPTVGLSLILVPLGLVEGAMDASRASECAQRWQAAVGDVPAWFNTTFGQMPALTILQQEVQRLKPEQPPAVVASAPPRTAQSAAELKEIGARLGNPVLRVADVYLALGPSTKTRCGVLVAANARVQLYRPEEPTADTPSFYASARQEDPDFSIEGWAQDPERAREQMRQVLHRLAARIANGQPPP